MLAISCVNSCDSITLPPSFEYNAQSVLAADIKCNVTPQLKCSCDCVDNCSDTSKCCCYKLTAHTANAVMGVAESAYKHKRLLGIACTGIFECNSRCSCKASCSNRVAQQPIQVELQLFKTLTKGWAVRCVRDIPKGTFICQYNGEISNLFYEDFHPYALDMKYIENMIRNRDLSVRKTQFKNASSNTSKRSKSNKYLSMRRLLRNSDGRIEPHMHVDSARVGNISRFVNVSALDIGFWT